MTDPKTLKAIKTEQRQLQQQIREAEIRERVLTELGGGVTLTHTELASKIRHRHGWQTALDKLCRDGLVQCFTPRHTGRAGRNPTYYRLGEKAPVPAGHAKQLPRELRYRTGDGRFATYYRAPSTLSPRSPDDE